MKAFFSSHKKIILPILIAAVAAAAILFIRAGRISAFTKTDFFFDTYVSIAIYDKPKNEVAALQRLDHCIELCQKYENMLSRTVEGSDIYAINHAGGDWVQVSDDTVKLLHTSLSYCDFSGGLADITIAPVKDLWNFSGEGKQTIPKDEALYAALLHVNYKKVEINGNRVRLQDPQAQIDLGFSAKGYIADQIKAYLLSEHVENALINLGGNVQTIGQRPNGTPFRIGIQKPFEQTGTFITVVETGEKNGLYSSVVTSGIYERYFIRNDMLCHHILNPKTGYPMQNELYSVTILANSSVDADALSTTCMLMGLDESLALIKSMPEVEAVFITNDMKIIDTRSN